MHNDLSDSNNSLKLASSARERWYLLSFKSMQVPSVILMVNNCNPNIFYYVHGQYMASHLSKSITKESAKLKRLLAEYNSTVQPHEQLTWEQVCDLSSPMCAQLDSSLDIQVPKPIRIAIINVGMKNMRGLEENKIIEQEMKSVITFHISDVKALAAIV